MTVKKHLTLSQRIIIENGLREGKKINRIAREAKVSRSTVVREIKAYRCDRLEWSCRFGGQNFCVKRGTCGVFGVCNGGMSAFEMMRFVYGEECVESARALGLVEIPANEVNLTPALIPDIARQVIEKAKRIGDEDAVARKAVEEYRRMRGE